MLKKNAMTLAMLVAGTTFMMPAMRGAEPAWMEEAGLPPRERAQQEEAIRAKAYGTRWSDDPRQQGPDCTAYNTWQTAHQERQSSDFMMPAMGGAESAWEPAEKDGRSPLDQQYSGKNSDFAELDYLDGGGNSGQNELTVMQTELSGEEAISAKAHGAGGAENPRPQEPIENTCTCRYCGTNDTFSAHPKPGQECSQSTVPLTLGTGETIATGACAGNCLP